MFDVTTWPEAPEDQRPKKLFVEQGFEPEDASLLKQKGWAPFDIRTLPNQSDAQRAEAVKAVLEGVRIGSIEANDKRLKHIELEARIYGLLNTKQASDKKEEGQSTDIDTLLTFSSPRAFRGTWNPSQNDANKLKSSHVPDGPKPKRKPRRKVPSVQSAAPSEDASGEAID